VVSAEVQQITQGTYVQAADAEVRDDYVLDPHEPRKQTPAVPPGFMRTGGNRSWLIYQRCP
jgi:hypothetical protein